MGSADAGPVVVVPGFRSAGLVFAVAFALSAAVAVVRLAAVLAAAVVLDLPAAAVVRFAAGLAAPVVLDLPAAAVVRFAPGLAAAVVRGLPAAAVVRFPGGLAAAVVLGRPAAFALEVILAVAVDLRRVAVADVRARLAGFLAVAGLGRGALSTEISGLAARIAEAIEFSALAAAVMALVAVAITVMATFMVRSDDATLPTADNALDVADVTFFGASLAAAAGGMASAFFAAVLARAVVAVRAVDLAAEVLRLGAFLAVDCLVVAFLAVALPAPPVRAEVFLAAVLFVRPAAVVRPAVADVPDLVATDLPPVTISYGDIYSTVGDYLHTVPFRVVPRQTQVGRNPTPRHTPPRSAVRAPRHTVAPPSTGGGTDAKTGGTSVRTGRMTRTVLPKYDGILGT